MIILLTKAPFFRNDVIMCSYDVLLEDYEKGMTSQRLDEIFSEVGGAELRGLGRSGTTHFKRHFGPNT